MTAAVTRLAFIDALKAIASQLIVLHHLAFYGPMSDFAEELAPVVIAWLSQDARIAVQVFLVIGGFLAAKGLAPEGRLIARDPFSLAWNRYLKLSIPYLAALLVSIFCAFIARQWMDHDSIPGTPTLKQLLAHAVLLQNILEMDALSAGVWYIAIDFQLFALLLGTLWVGRSLGFATEGWRAVSMLLVGALGVASLYYFNRDASWDDWAFYFFGSYGLGALTYWASRRKEAPDWLGVIVLVVTVALLVDFRSRIAVALLAALALGLSRHWNFLESWPNARPLAYLGRISYSVFLLNFPVSLIVNALFSRYASDDPAINALGVLLAWAACIAAGTLFYHFVESRTRQIQAAVGGSIRLVGRRLVRSTRRLFA